MKKFLFSMVVAIFAITMSSCQSQEDMPEAPVAPTASLESTFPAGSEDMNVNVNIQDDNRTRSGDIDLPLWDLFDGTRDDVLHVRYGVYDTDGHIYYHTPDNEDEYVKVTNKNFSLKIPRPANEQSFSIFIWADKYGASTSTGTIYEIDWNAYTVEQNPSYANIDLSKSMDAFCCYSEGLTEGDEMNIVLKRPFVQINLLSDELLLNNTLAKKWGGAISTNFSFTLCETDGTYIPYKWNYFDDIVSFKSINPNSGDPMSYVQHIGNTDNFYLNNPFTGKNISYATLFGRKMVYIGTWYFFAPAPGQERERWIDDETGDAIDLIQINLSANGGARATHQITRSLPDLKQNARLVLYNGNGSETGSGIFTNEGTLNVLIDDAYEDEITESMM